VTPSRLFRGFSMTDALRDAIWLMRHSLVVLRDEGLGGACRWTVRQAASLGHRLWFTQSYAVHVTSTCVQESGLLASRIEGLEVHFLSDISDVERLCRQGYQDVRCVVRPAHRRLRDGAVCMCVYIDRKVAHVEWLALTETVRRAIFPAPCFVAYDRGEASWGGAHTPSRYRKQGVFRYGMACALHYCHERGYEALVGVTAVDNIPSLRGQTPFEPRVRARLRYRCLLARRTWTVVPLDACGNWPAEEDSSGCVQWSVSS